MAFIKSYQGQNWLLPPNLEDLIPQDHICYAVECFVASMDFSSFEVKYSGAGHPAYHPKILVKLLVMGVLDRIRSSRRLARNARENVVYMYLAEKLIPDFRTISDFRKNNPTLIKEAFKHTITIAKQEGLIDLSHISTDGSIIKANAANKGTLTKNELEFLLKFVDEELEEWAKSDELEDDQFKELRGNDQLPNKSKKQIQRIVKQYVKKMKEDGGEFKKKTKDKLKKAHKELEKHDLKKISMTDPDSRFMKNKKGGIELSYNVQLTVDNNGFILTNDVCQDTADNRQLQPQVIQTEKNLGSLSKDVKWCFDNGYFGGENLKFLDEKNIDAYIPCAEKNEKKPFDKKHFKYDITKDEYICPANKKLKFKRINERDEMKIRVYQGQDCKNCQNQNKCANKKTGIRQITARPHEVERIAMEEKMKTLQAREIYKLRSQTVEPAFGDIKENKGFRTMGVKGLKRAKIEFNLVCTATNIRRIMKSLLIKYKNLKNLGKEAGILIKVLNEPLYCI